MKKLLLLSCSFVFNDNVYSNDNEHSPNDQISLQTKHIVGLLRKDLQEINNVFNTDRSAFSLPISIHDQ